MVSGAALPIQTVCVLGSRKVVGEKSRHPSSGAQCSDVITTLSRPYDSLDILRREELLLRHRTHNGAHKSVRFLLVDLQGGE